MKRRLPLTGGATTLLALGAWLAAAACLNPRPEELPSDRDGPPLSGEAETDGPDNSGGTPIIDDDAPPSANNPSTPGSAPSPTPGDDGSAGADAGAPDAGLRPLQTGADAEPESETEECERPE